jgi:hypothetical protein
MKSIAEKLKETIKLEEARNFSDKNFEEIDRIMEEIDKLGYPKPNYSFPLVDTIGKTVYPILNK